MPYPVEIGYADGTTVTAYFPTDEEISAGKEFVSNFVKMTGWTIPEFGEDD